MNPSSLSFQLLDRIADIDGERSASGSLAIPAEMPAFPVCLAVEAIGQLAAWVAIRRSDFTRRPVAAVAGRVRVLSVPSPGRRLDLEVVIRRARPLAIAYEGVAREGGRTVVELSGATGAMVPMAEFEDPAVARAHFAALLEGGIGPRRFPDRLSFAPRVVSRSIPEPGRRACAELEVPPHGELYGDHFPRRAVYPATLSLDAQLAVALELLSKPHAPDGDDVDRSLVGGEIREVRVRAFTPPGSRIAVSAEVLTGAGAEPGWITVEISSRLGEQCASSALLSLPSQGV